MVAGNGLQSSTSILSQTVYDGRSNAKCLLTYTCDSVIGTGNFGVVYKITIKSPLSPPAQEKEEGEEEEEDNNNNNNTITTVSETAAIKKVLQDPKFKNREVQLLKILHHKNITGLKCYYYQQSRQKPNNVYLNLVMDYLPMTIFQLQRQYMRQTGKPMPVLEAKVYFFQLLRSLAYMHSLNITHRDLKPQNLLVDPATCMLKVCDFGSAKQLSSSETNVSYICSRYYRAPELIFGATRYCTKVDMWSAGCIGAEMLTASPLLAGDSTLEQLMTILRMFGSPTPSDVSDMMDKSDNPPTVTKIPNVQGKTLGAELERRLKHPPPSHSCELLDELLVYSPVKRSDALNAMGHEFFDELFDPDTRLPPQIIEPLQLNSDKQKQQQKQQQQQEQKGGGWLSTTTTTALSKSRSIEELEDLEESGSHSWHYERRQSAHQVSRPLPELFDFTNEEIKHNPEGYKRLIEK